MAGSGALAGILSTLVFMVVHDLLISDIWFSAPLMLGAGAVCGLCVAWTYSILFKKPAAGNWFKFNLIHLFLFAVLGVVSELLYEPTTTVAALISANEPPGELIMAALPLTVVFTLSMSLLISTVWGKTLRQFLAVFLTCSVLVLLLGLNVSVIGLVSFPSDSIYLLGKLFLLIFLLVLVYAGIFLLLQRNVLFTD